jgi:hypothetical protein
VEPIKWPPRLTEDAVELYEYKNSEISAALFDSRPAVIAILLANDPSIHPIIADYDVWMAVSPQLGQVKHADAFAQNFLTSGFCLGTRR